MNTSLVSCRRCPEIEVTLPGDRAQNPPTMTVAVVRAMVQSCFPARNPRKPAPWMGSRLLAQHTSEDRTITSADAAVDIDLAKPSKQHIKYLAQKKLNRSVISEIGGFGGLFAID